MPTTESRERRPRVRELGGPPPDRPREPHEIPRVIDVPAGSDLHATETERPDSPAGRRRDARRAPCDIVEERAAWAPDADQVVPSIGRRSEDDVGAALERPRRRAERPPCDVRRIGTEDDHRAACTGRHHAARVIHARSEVTAALGKAPATSDERRETRPRGRHRPPDGTPDAAEPPRQIPHERLV